jgi:mono/diheme cytochrome c family protein
MPCRGRPLWHLAQAPAQGSRAWAIAAPKTDSGLTDPLVRRAKAVFDGHCRTCHGIPTSLLGDDDLKAVATYQSRHKAMD